MFDSLVLDTEAEITWFPNKKHKLSNPVFVSYFCQTCSNYRPQQYLRRGYVFTSVCHSVRGGACMAGEQEGMCGGGACMAGVCVAGGMHGGGACVAAGHAWRGHA